MPNIKLPVHWDCWGPLQIGTSETQGASPLDPGFLWPGWATSAGSLTWPLPRLAIHERVNTESQYLSTCNSGVCTMEAPTGFFPPFPEVSIRVVFNPGSNLVLREPLKMSQEGQKSQTVRRLWQRVAQKVWWHWPQGQGVWGKRTLLTSLCLYCWWAGLPHATQLNSQLEVLISFASQGHKLTQLMDSGPAEPHMSPHLLQEEELPCHPGSAWVGVQ